MAGHLVVSSTVLSMVAKGAVYFGASAGYNTVTIRGYSAAATSIGYGGTPHATDMIDLVISGGRRAVLRQQPIDSNISVVVATATGSSQSDAAQLVQIHA
jgi:hypothetical protein